MTPLQLLHVGCATAYVAIALYVLQRAPQLRRSIGFAGIALCFAWWSATLVVAHEPGISESQAAAGYDLGVIAWASFGSLAVAFALAFAGASSMLALWWVRALLVVPPFVVMAAQWSGELAVGYPLESWGRAYEWALSPGTAFFYVYYGIYVTGAITIVALVGMRSTDRAIRRQALIITTTAMVSLFGSTTTDVLLPWLGIHSIPNVAPSFLLVWTIGIAVAIVRYQLLVLTPESAAGEILAAMTDAVLLVGRDGRVVSTNSAAADLIANGIGLAALAAGGEVEVEARGHTLLVARSTVHDLEGAELGKIHLFRDITERKRVERELADVHAELEARVAERTRELDHANRELQRAMQTLGGVHAAIDAIHRAHGVAEIAAGLVTTLGGAIAIPACRVTLDGTTSTSVGFVEIATPKVVELVAAGKLRGTLELHVDRELTAAEREIVDRIAFETAQTLESLALRNAIAQSDRLASIGALAASVAHEINNPLASLKLGLHDLQENVSGGELRTRVDEVIHGADRIAKIVRELGSFARDGDEVRPVAISEAVTAATAMARHQIRHRAQLVVDHRGPAVVVADLGRLTQVFLNLLVNAVHSIPEGQAETNQIAVTSRTEGGEVIVTVSDTGSGLGAEDVAHVFEPFYSTQREGAGLGLAISHKIVRSLGGTLIATSAVDRGTTFTIRLPAARAATEPEPPPPVAVTKLPPARILIVDDDLPVAKALSRFLGEHQCVIAPSGAAARKVLEEDPAFDVVISDIMMPDLTGPGLYTWIEAHQPQLVDRVLFMTGGTFTPHAEAFLEQHHVDVLVKPFDLATVKQTLARYLASDRRQPRPERQ